MSREDLVRRVHGGDPVDPNEDEDWLKPFSWDFWGSDGKPIDRLEDLADAIGCDQATAAEMVRALPMGRAAPAALRAEVDRYGG